MDDGTSNRSDLVGILESLESVSLTILNNPHLLTNGAMDLSKLRKSVITMLSDRNALKNHIEKIMTDIKTKIQRTQDLLKLKKIPAGDSGELNYQDDDSTETNCESKIPYMIRESAKAAATLVDLLQKQKILVNEVDEWQSSEDDTDGNMTRLIELKSQIENMNLKGHELMDKLHRLDIMYLQNEYGMMEKCEKIITSQCKAELQRENTEPPDCPNLFEFSTTFKEREMAIKLQSDANDMKVKLETFKNMNEVALKMHGQRTDAVHDAEATE